MEAYQGTSQMIKIKITSSLSDDHTQSFFYYPLAICPSVCFLWQAAWSYIIHTIFMIFTILHPDCSFPFLLSLQPLPPHLFPPFTPPPFLPRKGQASVVINQTWHIKLQ